MRSIKEKWASLDEDRTINGKLLFFEFAAAVLAGILLGILITPFRSITIASNNENCTADGNKAEGSCACDCCEED
ncbi:MAG: hypothetical protein K6E18_03110 [Lachnospiraceae bacterium]|nr:hypothetical protein [Lachnospiraceae bacterium]